jgi:hypothetical protein
MFISPIRTGVPGPIRPLTAAPPMPALTDERACRNVLTWLRELDSHRYFHPSYYAGREIVEVDVLGETMELPIDSYGAEGTWIYDSIVPLSRGADGRWSLVSLQRPPTPAAIPDRLVFVEEDAVQRGVVIPRAVPLARVGHAALSATQQECLASVLLHLLDKPLSSAPDPHRLGWRQLKCGLKAQIAAQIGREASVDLVLDSEGRLAECRVNLLRFEGVDYRLLDLVFPLPSVDVQFPATLALDPAAMPCTSALAEPAHLQSCAPFDELALVEPGALPRIGFTNRRRIQDVLYHRRNDFEVFLTQWKGSPWGAGNSGYVEVLMARFHKAYEQGGARWIDMEVVILAARINVGDARNGEIKELWVRMGKDGVRTFDLAPELPDDRRRLREYMRAAWRRDPR